MYDRWNIYFNLCSEHKIGICNGTAKYACQTKYDSNWDIQDVNDLGSLNKTNFMDDGVTLTYRGYISPDSPRGWCSEGAYEISFLITNFNLLCDKGVDNVDVSEAKEPISCYYNVTLKSKKICQCPSALQCSQPHGKCVNCECVCDQSSSGTFCENLIITIDSIGDHVCTNIEQLNEILIKCDVGKGSGFKYVISNDRDLTVHVMNLFQYFKPITINPQNNVVCISPWIGNDCKSKIISIPQPSLNYSNPVTDIQLIENKVDTKLFRSLVSIVKLRELDFQSKQVNSFTFIEWEYYKINE
ncbi:hypothetical protein DDB_G0290361 [Dictyostelium discoideum AX4]|uniref:MRH domain-containing protein n=1 Tax=Dictyostelium discoideum TaxID=44689 RepID=Q54GB6_DICDI|nr:hypothetical protein DDB_G0290361 [Dictyostelium discoideum AX4]EAL62307.1 hypothetical protein DDB_G0290361 [Dictyostelium discoideum AX4]|eukprot:XP_635767.1 hypothetical protein DDB_G0290361 [Dictyostelium discoideum AX4]